MTTSAELTAIDAHLLIKGAWADAAERVAVVSPATGEAIGTVPQGTTADIDHAVRAARQSGEEWAGMTVFARAEALRRVSAALAEHRDELALTLALEQGKPLKREAYPEVDSAIAYFEIAGQMAITLHGTMPPSTDPRKRVFIYRQPRGVVGAIQPWNFPLETIAMQSAPALATGNAIVCVPAPTTSLSAYVFARCVAEAELPAGVFNLVSGPGPVVGDALTGHAGVDVVLFTGSSVTGRRVAERAAGKAQILELGGNGPFIVLDDADLDLAVPAALVSCFMCAGQQCTAAERILVHERVHDEFAERLTSTITEEIRLGHPLDDEISMGPLNNEKVAAKMDEHVADALARGAELLCGGSRAPGHPTDLYWEPTVLSAITDEMVVANEETFGPLAPLQRISSEQQALDILNSSQYGLASSVFSRDIGRGLRFAERARTGTVILNEGQYWFEQHLPFGGAPGKASGLGRAQGRASMEQVFTETKTVFVHLG